MIIKKYCKYNLPVSFGEDGLITEEFLSMGMSMMERELSTRKKLSSLVMLARKSRQKERARVRRLHAHQRRRQREVAKKIYNRAKRQGTAAALQWLIEQQSWEQAVLQATLAKVGNALGKHLESQIPVLPWGEILSAWIAEISEQPDMQVPLTLQVPEGMPEVMVNSLKKLPLSLEFNATIESGFVWIQSDIARVQIPLGHQLDQLSTFLKSVGK